MERLTIIVCTYLRLNFTKYFKVICTSKKAIRVLNFFPRMFTKTKTANTILENLVFEPFIRINWRCGLPEMNDSI